VHGIVRQIGGHILVYSEPGFGTTFRIYFPVADAEIVTAAAPVSTAAETAGAGTVLLVEDEVKVLETVKLMLTRQGYSVLEASSQESAQRICGEYPHRIDLLLTDVVLRNGNGPDLARELSFLRPGVPVVYMSGYPDPFPVWDSVGVVFLQKPFSSRSLQTAIEKARAAIDSQAETCDTQSCYEGIPTGFHITADRSRGCSGV